MFLLSLLTLLFRCAADLMVETEVRETMVKSFEEMPSEYWNTPQSLSKVGIGNIVGNSMHLPPSS